MTNIDPTKRTRLAKNSFLLFCLLFCLITVGYCTVEKEDFSGPRKIIAVIPADFHLIYCLDRNCKPVGFVLLTKDGMHDSYV